MNADRKTPVAKTPTTKTAKRVTKNSLITPASQPQYSEASIAEAAYFLAEKRGFSPGYELQDWLAAIAQLQAQSDIGG